MTQMKVEQLFSKGKYMVIYISPDTLIPVEMSQFLWDLDTPLKIRNCTDISDYSATLQQWRSLIVVSGTPYR